MRRSRPWKTPLASRGRTSVRPGQVIAAVIALSLGLFGPAPAQETAPTVRAMLTGYGSVGYTAMPHGRVPNDFTASLVPVGLFQIGPDILVEGEVEAELEGNRTELHLEHAQVHYLGLENFQLSAGMGHLPFGFWNHASWVNKLPTEPLLFEDTHGFPATDGLMPIPLDVGIRGEANFQLDEGLLGTASAWISQGPAPATGETHAHGEAEEGASSVPDLGYGFNFSDNNADKMTGVRLRAVAAGGLTLQASGFRALYDDADELGIRGVSGALVVAPGGPTPRFDFRAEGILFDQDFRGPDHAGTVMYGGYYVQLSRLFENVEPVVRWSHLPPVRAGGGHVVERRRQLSVGLNFLVTPSVPLKVAYNVELDRNDALFIEWAMGF